MNTTIRNEKLLCLNCGGEHKLNLPIPFGEMTKKMGAFNELHKNCEKTWTEPTADQDKTVNEKAMWWIANVEVVGSICENNKPLK